MIKLIEGNLLDSEAKYIVHQANCVSKDSAGIARAIFDKYPYSNIYEMRGARSIPGTLDIRGNGEDERFVINAFAQYYPGPPIYDNDKQEDREDYFKKCLNLISHIDDLDSVAFPYGIGCGLAKGNWDTYYSLLEEFSHSVSWQAEVFLYRID